MKNFKHNGKTLNFTASAALTSGQLLAIGLLVGIVAGAYANGDEGVLNLEGVYEVPCKSTDVVAVGDQLYFDESEGELTKTSTDNIAAGKAMSASPDGTTVVEVKLG